MKEVAKEWSEPRLAAEGTMGWRVAIATAGSDMNSRRFIAIFPPRPLTSDEPGVGLRPPSHVIVPYSCFLYCYTLRSTCGHEGRVSNGRSCSTLGQLDDDVRIAQNYKPYTPQEMEAVAKLAITAGPGGLKGPALEYWKIGGEWK